MMTFKTFLLVVAIMAAGSSAHAQEWRGLGRVGGKVVDESGKPVEGVTVKAVMPASQNRGPGDSKTKSNGEWAVGGIARGQWALDFVKEGYQTASISVVVQEGARIPPMEIVLKKAAPEAVDPNIALQAKLREAAGLMNAKQYAAARAIYEALEAEHPQVKQFKPLIARAYYGEGNKEKALELLREASAADPENVEVKMLLGNLLMEAGKADEAKTVLASVDDSKITDPVVYINIAIASINDGKHADALPWLDKAVAKFPDQADAYYYRGISYLATGKNAEAKADLTKFIAMAKPDAPELPTAKKILESIK
jgi:tetratricopeptide (TPR) repeat protein